AAVMSAITPTPREVPSLYSQRPSRAAFVEPRRSWRTAFAGVGAAAAIVLLAVLLFNVGGGGLGGADGGAGGDEAGAPAARQAPEVRRDRVERAEAKARDEDASATEGGAVADSNGTTAAATQEAFSAPTPVFGLGTRALTNQRLARLGRHALSLVLFSRAYNARDVVGLEADFVDQLVASAQAQEGSGAGEQVRRCAEGVLTRLEPTLPAFGSFGRLGSRDVLVLGFAWSDREIGALDRFLVATWERGSCSSLIEVEVGRIKPRP
ncbi:MAG: hypothetical protein M3238_01915, partial [Actinomycetota bacterium]|nr:hypothetical protein [Actinomycetota bacterium]